MIRRSIIISLTDYLFQQKSHFISINQTYCLVMKHISLTFFVLVLLLGIAQLSTAAKPERTISGIKQDWRATKYLDEIYFLRKGWTSVKVKKNGQCDFEKYSWDDIDSYSALYRDILREADLNNDARVTTSEASQVLAELQRVSCRNKTKRYKY